MAQRLRRRIAGGGGGDASERCRLSDTTDPSGGRTQSRSTPTPSVRPAIQVHGPTLLSSAARGRMASPPQVELPRQRSQHPQRTESQCKNPTPRTGRIRVIVPGRRTSSRMPLPHGLLPYDLNSSLLLVYAFSRTMTCADLLPRRWSGRGRRKRHPAAQLGEGTANRNRELAHWAPCRRDPRAARGPPREGSRRAPRLRR
jgi:hypothetical protein